MELYFKDRIPDEYQGQNNRFYDAIDVSGTVKLPDVKLELKNNIPEGREGTPLSAGNLNYASGNIVMPSSAEVQKGDVVSLAGGAVGRTNVVREVAAKGLDSSVAFLSNGFLRLSDNKLLLIYSDRMVVATVDFANHTVSFGAYLTTSYNLSSLSLIRSFGDSPVAVVCGLMYDSYGGIYAPVMYRIDENGNITIRLGSFPASFGTPSNFVRVSNSSVLICGKGITGFTVSLYSINSEGTPYFMQDAQITVPALANITPSYMLFAYDRANGKYMFVYTYQDLSTLVTRVYGLPVSVSGNTITAGTPQVIGTSDDTLYQAAAYISGGTDRFSPDNNRIILSSGVGSSSNAKFQVVSIDSSGAVSKGAIYDTPLAFMGNTSITYRADGIYLSGTAHEDTGYYEGCLLDVKISGTSAVISEYKPFMTIKASQTGGTINAVYENPNNTGEFLFIQGYNKEPVQGLRFWFGYKTDGTAPDNVIGIALENASGGYARVQATSKHLPGIFGGLTAGQFYQAGDNGGLAPVSGASASNVGVNVLGIATSATDLLFFGARGI